MVRFLGIEFAPLHVPLERRLQVLSVAGHLSAISLIPLCGTVLLGLLLITRLWFVSVGYVVYIYYDKYILQTSQRGGRSSQLLRTGLQAKYFQDYFPVKLVKTGDLDPNKNYIVGYHPHGIAGFGSFGAFACDYGMGFSKLYPGLRASVMTLNVNLMLPFLREYALLMGLCDVDRESIEWLLTQEGTGNALMIIVGGAEEALEAKPGCHRVVLKNRKGFVKHAIKHGADLVPVYGFGESDMYNQVANPHGSLLRTFQTKTKKLLSFSLPAFYGRGFFNYSVGFLPHRTPINVVVGYAIPVPHDPTPQSDVVDQYHAMYMDGLKQLFEDHKANYGVPHDVHLEIL